MRRRTVIIHGGEYDVEDYQHVHPGGAEVLARAAASGDGSAAFDRVGHSDAAVRRLASLHVRGPLMPLRGRRVARKLVTTEDRWHAHKTLGMLALTSSCLRTVNVLDWRAFPRIRVATAVAHAALSLSSFRFHVPWMHTTSVPTIHAMFRAHNIAFALRAVATELVDVMVHAMALRVVLCDAIVASTMVVADRISVRFDTGFRTTASMPYWPEATARRIGAHKAFYSVSQLAATSVCTGAAAARGSLLRMNTLAPIQGAAFLMTLVRKGILGPYGYHMVYSALLLSVWVRCENLPLWACITTLVWWLRRRGADKYLLWGAIACARNAFSDAPWTTLASAITYACARHAARVHCCPRATSESVHN